MFISSNDLKEWCSSHPHTRHCIVRVKQLLADVPPQPQLVRPAMFSSTMKRTRQKLLKYQTSAHWPQAVSYMRLADADAEQMFQSAQAVQRMAPAN